ncbi:MAG: acylphosphatase [Actinomycetota bacterium]
MDNVRKRVLVSGRVQGVFFRATCRDVADDAGVDARASNLADGRVEVIVEGAPNGVQRVIEWCRAGPPHARVTGVEVTDL